LKTKLLLFDIDGTLLTPGGAGVTALILAMKDLLGRDTGLSEIEVAGRTDSGIARQIFDRHGIEPTAENFSRFFESYLRHLAETLPGSQGSLLPGIVELLEKLRARPEVALALLTGNLVRGARLKLEHYGVWEYFEFGAFADDHHDRNQLGQFAKARALEKHGVDFPPESIYVLGDTPHDIACGRAIGAKTVAIATGGCTREELQAHQPDFLFDDLSDVDKVLKALGI
jgi:phosphoglycolate phosphatase-like HAD superfamily hydrolase